MCLLVTMCGSETQNGFSHIIAASYNMGGKGA